MNNNATSLTIDNDTKTLDNIRSMFFKLNAKPDSITRTFSKQIRVNIDSLEDLNLRVREKLRMHCEEKASAMTYVTINCSNHKSYDYATWEKFKRASFSSADYIESITIKWDFLVTMPQYEYPQPHCLVVKISSGLKMTDFFSLAFSGKLEDVNDINILDNTVVARVDFINTLLGEEVLNVVSDWVEACNRNNSDCNKFLLFLRKHRKATAILIENVMNIVGSLALFFLLYYYVKSNSNNNILSKSNVSKLIIGVGILYALIYIIKRVSRIVTRKTIEELTDYGEGLVFEITKGDKQQIEDKENSNSKAAIQIFIKLCFSFIFDLICTIIISYIY